MTEEVEPSPVAQTPSAPAPPAVNPHKYDESLLIRDAKGRVIAPTQPDQNERNLQVDKLRELEQKYRQRVTEINAAIDLKRNSSRSVSSGQQEIIKRLQDLKNQFTAQLRDKQAIRDRLTHHNAEKENVHAQLRSIKEKTKDDRMPLRLDIIDSRIAELEHKLNHESLDNRDWAETNERLTRLRNLKPLAQENAELSQRLNEVQRIRTELIEKLKQMDEVLSGIKNVEEQERKRLQDVRSKEQEEGADIPSLSNERKECFEVINKTRDKITEIRSAFDQKWQEYIKLDRNHKDYVRFEKFQKYEERKKKRESDYVERNEKRQEHKAQFQPAVEDPYSAELFKCDQMLVYLKKLSGVSEATDKVEEAKEVIVPDGMVAFKRKQDDELEAMFGGLAKKNKQKPEKNAKPVAKPAAAEASTSKATPEGKGKKLVHDLETLKTFMDIKVDVPQLFSEVEKTISKVEERKVEFKQKQVDELEHRRNPPPAPAAPAEAPKAEPEEAKENGHGVEPAADGPAAADAAPAAAAEEEEEEEEEEEAKLEDAPPEPAPLAEDPEPVVEPEEPPAAAAEVELEEPEPLPDFVPEPVAELEEVEPEEEAEAAEAKPVAEEAAPAKAPETTAEDSRTSEEPATAAPVAASEAAPEAVPEAAPAPAPEAAPAAAPEAAAAPANGTAEKVDAPKPVEDAKKVDDDTPAPAKEVKAGDDDDSKEPK